MTELESRADVLEIESVPIVVATDERQELRQCLMELVPYLDSEAKLAAGEALIECTNRLAAVSGKRIVFGWERDFANLKVRGYVGADRVACEAIGVESEGTLTTDVEGRVDVGVVDETGKVTGVRLVQSPGSGRKDD